MQVFTDEWAHELQRRYESQPHYQRPLIYFVSVRENYAQVRDEIEEAVAALPPAQQKSVIPRLRSIQNFTHTYNELAVGSALRRLGYEVDYEKAFGALTPDWYVSPTDTTPGFLVEVFTSEVSAGRGAKLRQIGDLLARLQEIPADVVLSLRLDENKVGLNSTQNKVIVQMVRQWLANHSPSVGAERQLNGVSFKVVHRSSNYSRIQFIGPGEGFMVNKEPLRKRLDEKVRKYKGVALDANLPLVVAVVAEFLTGLGVDDLQDVLLGQEAVQFAVSEETGTVTSQRLIRQRDGLFFRAPALSAAILAAKVAGEWKIMAIHNPIALNPLPDNAFSESSEFGDNVP